jgi:predicted metal-dependent phosphoesterase TrpH
VVKQASSRGLQTIAITDHDTVAGVPAALEAASEVGLECIPGVEMSCEMAKGEAHILGFFVSTDEGTSLSAMLARFRTSRLERARKILHRLARLGVPLDWEDVLRIAGGESVGRPHIARAMVEKGHVPTVAEAFERYLRREGPAYVPRFRVAPEEAIRLVHEAGGLAVLAHPWDVADIVAWLAGEGLDGLEAYYPFYAPAMSAQLAAIAERLGLVVTGGSDFHGPGVSAGVEMGSVDVPEGVVEALHERRQAMYGA